MKDFALKILNNPLVRKAFWALVYAVLGAAGYSQLGGCTPSQLERADSAIDRAQDEASKASAQVDCVQSALRQYDVLTHPEHTTPEEAAGLAAALEACVKPASNPDAGAR